MKVSHSNTRLQGSASHNDRTFDVQKADHIDQSRMGENRYWCIYEGMTFEEAEKKFYEEHYSQMIEEQNRYRKEKLDAGDYLRMHRYCPEELILQIGNVGDTVRDPAVFDECFDEYMAALDEWNRSHGGHMHVLDYAVHKDEATIHAHIRRTWDYTAKNGTLRIGPGRALKEAGVQLPDKERPEGRLNNRKIAFDRMMRERWVSICEEHGIEVDKVPVKARHQKISDYKRDRRIEDIERARANTRMVAGIAQESLGDIPADKLVMAENGERYVSLGMDEFMELKRAAEQMTSSKEGEARKDREAAAALERAASLRAATEAMREKAARIEAESAELREKAGSIGILSDVMQEGGKALREPNGLELEAIGTAGQAYDASKYASVQEAMDSLEDVYLGRLREQEQDGQGRG